MTRRERYLRWTVLGCVGALIAASAVSCRQQPPAPVAQMKSSAGGSYDGFAFSFAIADGTAATVEKGSKSCLVCHAGIAADSHSMHVTKVSLSCVDCHGGNAGVNVPANIKSDDLLYHGFKGLAHVRPKVPELWVTAANPTGSGAQTLQESKDYIRFVNPGDLRAARATCGPCHNTDSDTHPFIVDRVNKSMMSHGAMLWAAALYNNGSINRKTPVYAESYTEEGLPRAIIPSTRPSTTQRADQGILPALFPLPRWEITQPGNILRVFERGGKQRPVIGVPNVSEEPGKPDVKLSVRGFGTDVRTDPVFIGLQKTRLLDPTLNFPGSNDHPGDYRGSGCTACHVVYGNDSAFNNSSIWSKFGNRGESFSADTAVNPRGDSRSSSIRKSGHPAVHRFVKQPPSSTCISCHIHPGTNVVNAYLGYQWWDNETDGEVMYPKKQRYPTPDDEYAASLKNPEGASVRGLWSNLYPQAVSHAGKPAGKDFLSNLTSLNGNLKHTQFADFHGHGWVFRAVYKQDSTGALLDSLGSPVPGFTANELKMGVDYRWKKPGDSPPTGVPVHLKDIHLEMGMHCADCHFETDVHSTGQLHGETRNAVTIECIDCHGSAEQPAMILQYIRAKSDRAPADKQEEKLARAFSGSAATQPSSDALRRWIKVIDDHFDSNETSRLYQKSTVFEQASEEERKAAQLPKGWSVVQTNETSRPETKWSEESSIRRSDDVRYTETHAKAARFAHTVRRDGATWGGDAPTKEQPDAMQFAHASTRVSCYACHTSWNTSCFGCHLPMRANQRKPMLHNEATVTRNYTNYNYQTIRDDVYMLGVDSTVKDHKVVPIRSACAVLVSSQDANRQWIYTQQQTISAEGYAGTAFSPYFPHTVRATETKKCTDCHLSEKGDNNAIMAQLLLQGTNSVNFIGRFAWLGLGGGGVEAVAVTERDEPQAVIGSRLHELAYPDFAKAHVDRGRELVESYSHEGEVLDVQLRGEYLYAACGPAGFIAYDVANIDNKGFSERIITAPVSPLGQRLYVRSKFATSICSPSTMAIDPTRPRLRENEEGKITEIGDPSKVIAKSRPIHPLYAYLYLTDREEGLIVIGNPADDARNRPGVATLLDGDPENNFISRAATYNPGGLLRGARHMAFHGTTAYVSCDAGLVVLDMNDPLRPRHVCTFGPENGIDRPRKVVFQFRYAFVCDATGIRVLDVTIPQRPKALAAHVPIADARDIYISRIYGYVAAGKEGLVVLDLQTPAQPIIDQAFNSDGLIDDAHAVRVGMTNSSLFAYIAGGRHGLQVVQLTSANDTPGYLGFSPRPNPRLIAWRHTRAPAIAISEGLDRDRAVDEAGNQLAVFGRRGARPFTLAEQQKLYLRRSSDGAADTYTVSNEPTTEPLAATTQPAAGAAPQPTERPRAPRRPPGR